MAGFNKDVTGDVGYFDELTLDPGSETVWWFTWDFDDRHWQRLSFVPVGEGRVTIVDEWVTHEVSQDKWGQHEKTTLWARLRNDYPDVVTVKATVFVAPTRYQAPRNR